MLLGEERAVAVVVGGCAGVRSFTTFRMTILERRGLLLWWGAFVLA